MQHILFLAANPLDTGRLRLEAEMRDVQDSLERAIQRDVIRFDSKLAVRVRDLRRSLLENKPQIVHFSGHGSETEGIVLENDEGDGVPVGREALANFFALHKESIRCVVLNACFSSEQAEAIGKHIPFVIGMSHEVHDDSARAFAVGFYEAIGAGRDYDEAFRHGRNAIELLGLPGHELPVLLRGQDTAVKDLARSDSSSEPFHEAPLQAAKPVESRFNDLIEDLAALGSEITRYVHCIGMHKAVPFDRIYQPTKLLFRSGLDISASSGFAEQNRIAQSIALSREQQYNSLTVENFLESPEDAIVFAGPGWGKTTFLHHLFRRKIEDRTLRTVLLTLRREHAINHLEELCRGWFNDSARVTERVLLLVDGYDEVALADRKRVSEALQRFGASNRGRFILTCRDYYPVIGLTASHVRIDGFDRKDQYRFVTAFLAAQGSSADPIKLVNELEERQFSEFLSHPLLLALACIVNSGHRTDQPRSALRLLRKALNALQHTWDLDRGVSRESLTALDGEDRMQILKRIAYASRTPFMKAERVENITRKALDKMQINRVNPGLVLQETAQFYGILVPSADGWEFVHRSIQDYLAAQYWVDSGGFTNRASYEWDTRTAYAACISGDATRVLEGALAVPEGLTCAIETLTNSPDFDNPRITKALLKFYAAEERVTVFERSSDGLSARWMMTCLPT
ncbi:CHAT domain-containing protein [Granulicella rosea]|uniref:CHAT domain-containing protein n=1 Tax=Granulicella rosea TaxID=474952 RepID=A0A239E9H8_9BACT|nr:CHAT domain-containing protein [Granulicella rosea]SNS40938.1 CHAT domain-containing protein [Granulicella rosea]